MSSFVETGQVEDNKAATALYAKCTTVLIPFAIVTLVSVGWLADNVQPAYLIPPAFLARGIVCSLFKTVKDPNDFLSYALVTLLVVTSSVQVISIESYFIKGLPKEVRGAMTLTLTFFCGLAATLFNYVGGPIFDKVGPTAPFSLTAILDGVFFIFAFILAFCCGSLRRPEIDNENGSDKTK